jgi:hypothetical protein
METGDLGRFGVGLLSGEVQELALATAYALLLLHRLQLLLELRFLRWWIFSSKLLG